MPWCGRLFPYVDVKAVKEIFVATDVILYVYM